MRTTRILAVIVLGAAAVLPACGKIAEKAGEQIAEKAAEQAGGGDVNVDINDEGGGIKIDSSEGSFQLGSGAEIPDGFPDSLPLPGDYQVVSSMTGVDSGEGMAVTLTSTDDFDTLKSDFQAALEDGGWTIDNTYEQSGGDATTVNWVVSNADYQGSVGLVGTDGEVNVSYTVAPKGD